MLHSLYNTSEHAHFCVSKEMISRCSFFFFFLPADGKQILFCVRSVSNDGQLE